MSNFDEQFSWQAQYIPQVVRLVAPHLIQVGRPDVDKHENGDLELVFPRNGTVSVRLRKPQAAKYAGDVTFRARGRNGGRSELSKVIDGYGDYMFFGHVSADHAIWFWHLLNLSTVRAYFQRKPLLLRRDLMSAPDGSRFMVFQPETDFPNAIVEKAEHTEAA